MRYCFFYFNALGFAVAECIGTVGAAVSSSSSWWHTTETRLSYCILAWFICEEKNSANDQVHVHAARLKNFYLYIFIFFFIYILEVYRGLCSKPSKLLNRM